MNTKKILIGLFIIVSILLVVLIAFLFGKVKPAQELPSPTPTSLQVTKVIPTILITSQPTLTRAPSSTATVTETEKKINKINVSGVWIIDPSVDALETTPNGDVLMVENNKYQIAYINKFSQFMITITSKPFEENRLEGELLFLEKLGLTKKDACRLTVFVNTVETVDPKLSGKNFNLSFCTD